MTKIRGIYALCDTSLNPSQSHLELAKKLLTGGIQLLQLRMKGVKDLAKVREIASSIKDLKKVYSFTFIVNDFVEVALDIQADGIHLGQDDLKISDARKMAGKELLIGYSSHSAKEAKQAEAQGADYVALGAIFPTQTKGPGHPVVGIQTLTDVVGQLKIPVVAIGGISRNNIDQVQKTGVGAAAMISALTLAPNISEEVRWFVDRWGI